MNIPQVRCIIFVLLIREFINSPINLKLAFNSCLEFIFPLSIASLTTARKIKRKGHYVLTPQTPSPPPNPSQKTRSASPSEQPYHFEEVHLDEYVNTPTPERKHYEIERYGHQENYGPSDHYGQQTVLSGTYLVDNGLRSIAKGSADQANSAVASQNAAGRQAAYVAKNTLAQAATQAAGTAVAVLKGKEVLLQRLEEQNAESVKAMQGELQQLQQAKRSAKAAQYAAQQALNHVSVLTAALNNAQSASELAQKSASEAAAELASQIDMVAQAKGKLEQVEAQLYTARLDYEETKDAAEKATLSAQEAQLNANDAALHANVELQSEPHTASGETTHAHLLEAQAGYDQHQHHLHDDHAHAIVKRRFPNEKIKKP